MKALLLPLLLLSSCMPTKGKLTYSLDGKEPVVTPISTPVSFEKLQKDILIPKCLECHKWVMNETRVRRKLVPGDAESSEMFQVLVSGEMPEDRPPLSTLELEMVRSYIDALKLD